MVEAELTTEVWNRESAAVEAESVEAESTAETESAAAEAESVEAESAVAETESVEAESTAEAESATAEAESMNAESTAEAESAAAEVESPCLCSPQQAPLYRLRLAWEPRSPSPPALSASANGPSSRHLRLLEPLPCIGTLVPFFHRKLEPPNSGASSAARRPSERDLAVPISFHPCPNPAGPEVSYVSTVVAGPICSSVVAASISLSPSPWTSHHRRLAPPLRLPAAPISTLAGRLLLLPAGRQPRPAPLPPAVGRAQLLPRRPRLAALRHHLRGKG
uniref:Uncharacterized protein n=1 Tax=Oryza glumipatula TaxID=40148 RepID=A0A0D9ZI44_9ORYZ